MTLDVRVLVFPDGDLFIAQGLEFDVAAQGRTELEALARFDVVMRAEMMEAMAEGRDTLDIGAAPHPIPDLAAGHVVTRELLAA